MNIEIRQNLKLDLYGLSAPVPDFKFGETGIKLTDRLWSLIKENGLPNKGINIWVYDSRSAMFCGIELFSPPKIDHGMEHRVVEFKKYAWYNHVGPYRLLYEANEKMRVAMSEKGLKYGPPSAEIYGHHGPDEYKLETEIIYTVS